MSFKEKVNGQNIMEKTLWTTHDGQGPITIAYQEPSALLSLIKKISHSQSPPRLVSEVTFHMSKAHP